MSEEQIKAIIEETVKQTLLKMGINVSTPEEVIEFQRDMTHLRDWRMTMKDLNAKALIASVGVLISGIAAAIWMAIRGPQS